MGQGEKFRWQDSRVRQRDEFARLLLNDDIRRNLFNDKFLEGLEKRRDIFIGRSQKVQLAQWAIALFLAVALLSVHISVSFFGISTTEARNLRELLLIGGASIQLFNTLSNLEHANVTELMQVMVAQLSKGDEATARSLRIRFGLGGGFSAFRPEGKIAGLRQLPTLVAGLIGLVGWMLFAIVVFLSIQVAAIFSILNDPTISHRVSFWVVVYVLLVDAATLSLVVMNSTGFAATEAKFVPKEQDEA